MPSLYISQALTIVCLLRSVCLKVVFSFLFGSKKAILWVFLLSRYQKLFSPDISGTVRVSSLLNTEDGQKQDEAPEDRLSYDC